MHSDSIFYEISENYDDVDFLISSHEVQKNRNCRVRIRKFCLSSLKMSELLSELELIFCSTDLILSPLGPLWGLTWNQMYGRQCRYSNQKILNRSRYQISGPSIPGVLVSPEDIFFSEGFLSCAINSLHQIVRQHETGPNHHIIS